MTRRSVDADYYVYQLISGCGVIRYIGKGAGRRSEHLLSTATSLNAGVKVARATKVHRMLAAALRCGESFQVQIIAQDLTQADAYTLEAELIARHRRVTEGGTLWNILAGGVGFQGILRADWQVVAAQAVETKRRTGRNGGAKAAETRRLTGRNGGAKAAATRRARAAA